MRSSYNPLASLALLLVIALLQCRPSESVNPAVGVVEGYYWPQSYSVFGQYGSYSHFQRLQLLQLCSDHGIGVYWYVPQTVSTISSWNATEASEWSEVAALGASLGVRVVYGLRPGFIESDYSYIMDRVQELHDAGIRSYSLNFDDAAGAATAEQKSLQVQVAASLQGNYTDMTLYFFTPAEYYQAHDGVSTTLSQWSTSLQTVDQGLAASVALVVTGAVITPSTMAVTNFPTLNSGRRDIFWDNWIAIDTNARLPWGLTSARVEAQIFNTPTKYGYMLNLDYPLERSIHQIACIGVLAATPSATCSASEVAAQWATWLVQNGFGRDNNVTSLASTLAEVISTDPTYNSIAELENAYPALTGVFSLPPVVPPSPPTGTSPRATSPPSDYASSLHLPFALVAFFSLIVIVLV